MDRPYYLPNSGPGSPQIDSSAEEHRPTIIYRLPQTGPFAPLVANVPDEISAGRLLFHLLLLGLTILTTLGVGILWFYQDAQPFFHSIVSGSIYSFSVIAILAAHEMGHYIACRWYGVSATLPYFIPMPIPPVGTFGAFIKIKSPIPTRKALFDIGIAGPLAGFVFAIPATLIGHYFAVAAQPAAIGDEVIYFQSPLLFKFFEKMLDVPPLVELNPVMWAAWIGLFMTSLNLLPVGQLDGGHVTYAVFGRRGHRLIAMACYLAVIGLAVYSVITSGVWNWVVYAGILTLMLRVGHPPVVDDTESLGAARMIVAVIGLLVFVLCFMPFPISF